MEKKDLKATLRDQARAYQPPYAPDEIRRKFKMLGKTILPKGAAAFFQPLPTEPDLNGLAYEMLKRGIALYPRVESSGIVFVEASPLDTFNKSPFGVLEPLGSAYAGSIDLIFVPGLMFSESGQRLGRGKGYYDRALENYKGLKAGVCFEACLCKHLPEEPHDIAMDFILTEDRLIDCRDSYRSGA